MRRVFYLCGMLAVLAATYSLPYLFPPRPSASLSYQIGFNNHAAMLTLLAGSLIFALLSRGAGLQLAPASSTKVHDSGRGRGIWLFAAILALAAAALALFWVRVRIAQTPAIGEAAFFLDRYREALRGGRVYRDFTFDYGPLLFYPPLWLFKLTHLRFIDAYFTVLLLEWIAGLSAIWYVLQRIASSQLGRALTFIIVASVWLTSVVDMGSNYTPLRFICSSAAAAAVYGLYRAGHHGWRLLLSALLAFAAVFFYSPEQGIAFLMATLLFFTICVRDRRMVLPGVLFAAGCVCILALGARAGYLRPLVQFGGGNYDFPILPSKQNIFLLLVLVCAACIAVASFFRKESARLELYLICLGLAGCPAAFGRSDPGHVFINTMPAIIVVLMTFLQSGTALMLVTLAVSCLYVGTSFKAHSLRMWRAVDTVRDENKNSQMDEVLAAAAVISHGQEMLTPFFVPVTSRTLQGSPLHSGEYFGFAMPNPSLAALKVAELQKHPSTLIFVPTDFEQQCASPSPKDVNVMLQTVLGTPFIPPAKHTVDVGAQLCRFVQTHYVAVPGLPAGAKYEVMEPLSLQRSKPAAR